jgi:TPR repeat protein
MNLCHKRGYWNADAQYNLGLCYRNGVGVEKDDEKAVELYQKAADRGNFYKFARINVPKG